MYDHYKSPWQMKKKTLGVHVCFVCTRLLPWCADGFIGTRIAAEQADVRVP